MQRLFSMFPEGKAGAALLVLRVSVAASLVLNGTEHWGPVTTFWMFAGLAIPAFFLCLGLFTPHSAIVCVVLQAVLFTANYGGMDSAHIASSIVVAGVVAVLGPGAYSVDARLFGRRIVTLPPRR